MKFTLHAQWGHARVGLLETNHGLIETPVFMPVGTMASVKAVSPEDLLAMDAQIILANTYHLYLRPGTNLIKQFKGLQEFMHWSKPLLTDSGGFQVSSLGHFRKGGQTTGRKVKSSKIDDDGVNFWSHLDGSLHRITPEKSIQIQHILNADIIMAFDEATPDLGKDYAHQAMERTHAWLQRSIDEWRRLESSRNQGTPQALFGIIQGGDYPDLRAESAQFVSSLDLPGIAIGGGSIGASRKQTSENIGWVRPYLPKNKPIYTMGVGVGPEDIIQAALDGADMFDCVALTRLARTGMLYNGSLFTQPQSIDQNTYRVVFDTDQYLAYQSEFSRARLVISNNRFITDESPIQDNCGCYTCQQGFSRAYLRHLYQSKELLYYRLASIHNLYHMIHTIKTLRTIILERGKKIPTK